MSKNEIDHPDYYNPDEIETIEVIESLGPEYAKGFAVGCIIKYSMRAGKKPGEPELKDLGKAQWYLNRYINYLKKRENKEEKNVKEEKVADFKIGDRVQSIYNFEMTGYVSDILYSVKSSDLPIYVVRWLDGTVSKNYSNELILFNSNNKEKK